MSLAVWKYIWKLVIWLAADGIMFGLTDAGKVPSFLLMVGFLMLAVTFYHLAYGLLTFARLYGLSVRRKRRLAGALTGLMVSLGALQSIGELNSRDVLLLLPLVVVAYAYSFYSRAGVRSADASS